MILVEKISVNIKIVSLNVEHNFLIPRDMSVLDATELAVRTLREEYPGVKDSALGYMLLHASSGKVLTNGCSLKQLGIVQGEKLLLI